MDNITLVFATISCITTILSIVFAILAFARGKAKDDKEENIKLETRLTSMEKDILYIRKSLDNSVDWRIEFDKRLYALEQHNGLTK